MADSKITGLSADTTPSSDDLVVTVNDPAGTPANKKVTLANLALGIGGAWASWTPTLSALFDDADWTKSCSYIQIGKTVICRLHLDSTTTSPMGGGGSEAVFTLPVTAVSYPSTAETQVLGMASLADIGSAYYLATVVFESTTTAKLWTHAAGGTYVTMNTLSTTVPF